MISFGELPKLPRPPKPYETAHEIALQRKWAKQYGNPLRQLSVPAKSTKDNPGSLLISAYGRRILTINPSASLIEWRENIQPDDESESDEEFMSRTNERIVSPKANCPVLLEKGAILRHLDFAEPTERKPRNLRNQL